MIQITKCIGCGELKDKFTKGSCKQCYQRKYQANNKERIKDYYQNNKERIREHHQKPEVKERMKEYRKTNKERINEQKRKYNQKPEVKEHIKKHSKEYHQRPEVKEREKEWRKNYRKVNKERIKEYHKEYYQRPRIKERLKKHNKEYYKNNKKYHSQACKKWQEANTEHLQEYRRKYYSTPNGKKARCNGMLKRKERIDKIIHDFSFYEWWEKVLETKGVCPECKENVGVYKLTMDHIMPVSKAPEGFIYTLEGVKPLCKPCNSSKSNSNDEYDLMPGALDTTLKEPEGISEILERIGESKNDNIQML